MFEIFSTREVVIYFYTLVFILYVFFSPKIRLSVINVIKSACTIKLVIPFIFMITYAALIVYALTQTPFWKWIYIKDIVIWVLFAGVPVCFNAVSKNIEDNYFRNIVIDNLKFLVLVEFFVGTFTFNLVVEFIMQPVLIFFILLEVVAGTKDQYKEVKKLMNWVVTISGFIILGFTINIAITSYSKFGNADNIVSFFIPIIFSLMYLPVAYGFAVYSKYEILFIRMSFKEPKDKKTIYKHRLKVISACRFSYKDICKFEKEYIKYMYVSMKHDEFNELINNFKSAR